MSIQASVIRGRGRGIVLQGQPETRAGVRVIAMPAGLLHLLRRIYDAATENGQELALVLPTMERNAIDPRNTMNGDYFGMGRVLVLGAPLQ